MFTKIIAMLGVVALTVGLACLPILLIKQKPQLLYTKTSVETTLEAPPTTPATLQVQEVSVNGYLTLCTMKDTTNDKEYIIIIGNTGVTITPRIPK